MCLMNAILQSLVCERCSNHAGGHVVMHSGHCPPDTKATPRSLVDVAALARQYGLRVQSGRSLNG